MTSYCTLLNTPDAFDTFITVLYTTLHCASESNDIDCTIVDTSFSQMAKTVSYSPLGFNALSKCASDTSKYTDSK
jgi:hypothetical protein